MENELLCLLPFVLEGGLYAGKILRYTCDLRKFGETMGPETLRKYRIFLSLPTPIDIIYYLASGCEVDPRKK